ncbi:VOC family protein [Enterococcus caccae]|uniref:VOC domain-containing protein n=1 Tax=Enterococcus caccae ATCC BAA-1240 TaxID=1158612 RepID=R3W727_9ENTE|nr:VOC family protein [Enterococcus caccae]EOL43531.1 hypothetical protein UC7_02861 [Enterococcus caccae ATCC BAA-1240]EOT68069.1 hypothetical protein I580_00451 [Enterococcus caccae ATCC BAA-1240]OJG28441.1 hypothetical protein RU98_GL000034 [Enterococcus caccae]
MEKFQLSEDVYVKTVALRIKDVEKMVGFYKNVLGFTLKLEENNLSIFGSQRKDSRLLILEESDPMEEQASSFNRTVCLSLVIPTEEEFGSLLRRITAHNYPIRKSVQQGVRKSVFLEDPEGNELEVSHQTSINKVEATPEPLDIQPLIQQSRVLYSSLSDDVEFDRIKLRVDNVSEHRAFYQDIFGMTSEGSSMDKLSMKNGNFAIYLDDSHKPNRHERAEKELLGVDFFVLTLENELEMKQLKQHLEEKQQKFFVDKKLTILTVYDPSEIEWWFVRD